MHFFYSACVSRVTSKRACLYLFSVFSFIYTNFLTNGYVVFFRPCIFSHFYFTENLQLKVRAYEFSLYSDSVLYHLLFQIAQRWRSLHRKKWACRWVFAPCMLRVHIPSYYNDTVKRRYTSAKKIPFLRAFAYIFCIPCVWVISVGGNKCGKLIKGTLDMRVRVLH